MTRARRFLKSTSAAALLCLVAAGCADRAPLVLLDGVSEQEARSIDVGDAVTDERLGLTSLEEGSVIPRDLEFPLFEWRGPEGHAGPYRLALASEGAALDVALRGTSWRPERGQFSPFLKGGEFTARVLARDGGRTIASPPLRVVVSGRPLGQRIAYRLVQPLFQPPLPNALVAWSPGEREPLRLMEFSGTCVGCHAYAPAAAAFNVKRRDRRRLVSASGTGPRLEFRQREVPGEFSFVTLAPDGRHAVLVQAPLGSFSTKPSRIEPFDFPYREADLAVYEIATGGLAPLPGASEPGMVEDMPVFSPDGGEIVFSRYRGEESGVPEMGLYRIPFNGGAGGRPEPIAGASGNGGHQYFARFAPNGRWLSFCRGDGTGGIYARSTSDIFLLERESGRVSRLRLNRDDAMDSWHDWSADSRWIVFSSNRGPDGLTALYLAAVDSEGRDAPPVKLAAHAEMKVNTPLFVPGGLDLHALTRVEDHVESTFAKAGE